MHALRSFRIRAIAATVVTFLALSAVPVSPASATGVSVRGNVSFGTSGNHPAGVSATILWEHVGSNPPRTGSAVTDSLGNYSLSLAPGSYRLGFYPSVSSYQSRFWRDQPAQGSANLLVVGSVPITGVDQVLPSLGTISGTVSLGSDGVLADAGQVRVTYRSCPDTTGCVWQVPPSTLTTTNGRYSISGLPTGVHHLTFELAAGSGFQPTTRVVTLTGASSSASDQNVTLTPTTSIVGTVMLGDDATPAGAGDVRVTAVISKNESSSTLSALTDSAGRYEIPGLGGRAYYLRFDYLRSDAFADEWFGDAYFPSSAVATVVSTEPVVRNATLAPAGSISGRVTASDGSPLAGVTVFLYTLDEVAFERVTYATVKTASDGTYSVTGLPAGAHYDLSFSYWPAQSPYADGRRGGDPLNPQNSGYVDVAVGQHRTGIDQVLYLRTGISGRVICDGCTLRGSLIVELERNAGTAASPRWVEMSQGSVSLEYGPGNYRLSGLAPGTYRIVVRGGYRSPSIEPNATATFEVGEGDSLTVNPVIRWRQFQRDFDGDSFSDVLARDSAGALRLYRGDGVGGWLGSTVLGSGWGRLTAVLTPGDFNSDSISDVIARDSSGGLWLFQINGGHGWFSPTKIGAGWNVFDQIISPGDFDGDGYSDVIARTRLGKLYLYPGNGDGGFQPSRLIGSGWERFNLIFSVGDFNGDDATDVMARTPRGALVLFSGNGSGGWLGSSIVGSGWQSFTAISGVGDFSGDGNPDVIVRTTRGELFLFRGNGTGLWSGSVRIATAWSTLRIAS